MSGICIICNIQHLLLHNIQDSIGHPWSSSRLLCETGYEIFAVYRKLRLKIREAFAMWNVTISMILGSWSIIIIRFASVRRRQSTQWNYLLKGSCAMYISLLHYRVSRLTVPSESLAFASSSNIVLKLGTDVLYSWHNDIPPLVVY